MKSLLDASVDVAVTAVIAAAVLLEQRWAFWIVACYTPLMLVLKAAAVFSGGMRRLTKQRRKAAAPPDLIYHLLYALNVALLAYDRLWLLAAGWLLIWLLSAAAVRK